MQAYRHETIILHNGTLTLRDLPLQAGEKVEVIIIVQSSPERVKPNYPLRGLPVTYIDPTEPIAEADWEAV
ncbi:hypothetical protein SE17_03650 [Kouleothrix aurantiaca]|uniref:Uncharacterized protein n=1 Tax=Kouleothrix aurantiaca TaxID=186479 RepID=A0A0P9D5W3_9CHLR|nr:hypothetical protein SE17_03650 [Kouleothrix aurantiaca]